MCGKNSSRVVGVGCDGEIEEGSDETIESSINAISV